LSARLDRYYGRLRRPPGTTPTSRNSPVIGRVAPTSSAASPGRGGPPQFPPPPSKRSTPHTPGGSSGLRLQALHPFHGLRREARGSAPPLSTRRRAHNDAAASLNAADRLVAPPKGLSTLGFDPARFQTEPPACYRASWQLPGRDSHPLATTSLCWITIYISASNPGHTARMRLTSACPFAREQPKQFRRLGACVTPDRAVQRCRRGCCSCACYSGVSG
jgi:hypothetical protein